VAVSDVGGERGVQHLFGLEAERLDSVEDALARTEHDGRDVEGRLVTMWNVVPPSIWIGSWR
jgi:hypothetical protein